MRAWSAGAASGLTWPKRSTDSQSSPVESTHVVRRGATIRGVADAHGVGEDVVREANGIAGSEPIYTGNRLRLSMPYPLFIHS